MGGLYPKKIKINMYYVYIIKVNDIIRYIGITNDPKKRQNQHNYLFKKGDKKELYTKLRTINPSLTIKLDIVGTFQSKMEAMRYEAYYILKDYFGAKQLYQTPPISIRYY